MTIPLDIEGLFLLIINTSFAVIGVLIKMELRDIKGRIERLENLFINRPII